MDSLQKIGFTCLGAGLTYQLFKMLDSPQMRCDPTPPSREELTRKTASRIDFSSPDYEMIVKEQLVRNYQFFGDEGQDNIRKGKIIVLGLDGIGTHLMNTLIRSGIQNVLVIDHGVVTQKDLTTSGLFFGSDLGQSKIKAIEKYLLDLCPHGKIKLVESKKRLFENKDWVLKTVKEYLKVGEGEKQVDFLVNTIPGLISELKSNIEILNPEFLSLKESNPTLKILNISCKILDPKLTSPSFLTLKKIPTLEIPSYTLTTILNPDVSTLNKIETHVFFPSIPSTGALYLSSFILAHLANHTLTPAHPRSITEHHVHKIHKKLKDLLIRQPSQVLKSLAANIPFELVEEVVTEKYKWKCSDTGRKACCYRLMFWELSETQHLEKDNLVLLDVETAKKFEKYLEDELGGYSSGKTSEAWKYALGEEGFNQALNKLK